MILLLQLTPCIQHADQDYSIVCKMTRRLQDLELFFANHVICQKVPATTERTGR
jgi:hypothetical protein